MVIIFLLCSLMTSFGASGRLSWRPATLPTQEVTKIAARGIMAQADDNNSGAIVAAALSLPKDKATLDLKSAIERSELGQETTSETWGKKVFSLGVVQTPEAKAYLMELWDKHDNQLSRSTKQLDIGLMRDSVPPLRVIADALHFYLNEKDVRDWFLSQIVELEKMPFVHDAKDPEYWRRDGRDQLLVHLYRWDLIDDVDRKDTIALYELVDLYPFSIAQVTNVRESVANYITYAKVLPALKENITEAEWMERRRNPREYLLDSTAILLGKPFALEVWGQYLQNQAENAEQELITRLWLISLWSCFSDLKLRSPGQWNPSKEEIEFLKDGVTYAEGLSDSHIRKLMSEALFGVLLCASENESQSLLHSLQARMSALLEEGQPERLRSLVYEQQIRNKD
jgi:hypothetical protein